MLNELRDRVGKINSDNGFHAREINIGELCALITSECSEMLEADRIGRHSNIEAFNTRIEEIKNSTNGAMTKDREIEVFKREFKTHIKEGLEAELVDCLIRVFDTAYRLNIDLDTLFELIIKHNSLRGYKHGKEY
jgi:NTP pyrophosphatase (non-canonical NTP hydrolase)